MALATADIRFGITWVVWDKFEKMLRSCQRNKSPSNKASCLRLSGSAEQGVHPHTLPVYQYQNDVLRFYKGVINPTAPGEDNVSKAREKLISPNISSPRPSVYVVRRRKWTPKQLSEFYAFFQNMVHLQLPEVPPLNWRNWAVSQPSSFHLPGQPFLNTGVRQLSLTLLHCQENQVGKEVKIKITFL